MNICIISNLYPPEVIGGAEKHAAADAHEFVERGHTVSVITTQDSDAGSHFSFEETESEDETVYRFVPINAYSPIEHQSAPLWKKPIQHLIDIWNPHVYALVRKKLDKIPADIIHIHNHSGLSPSVFAAASEFDTPIIHTLHDYEALHVRTNLFDGTEISEPGVEMKPYQEIYRRLVEPHLDYVISPSQFVLDKYNSEEVYSSVPSSCVPLGISAPDTSSDPPCLSNDGCLRLMFAGQHTYSKGIDILIKAVKETTISDLSLRIYGKGPESEKLRKLAAEDSRITFHGFVDEDELHDAYQSSHFTVVPSRWYDNSPVVIYESLRHGTPVIGANIGGIPELISEGETGFLFTPEDPESLRVAIERAADAPYGDIRAAVNQGKSYRIEDHADRLLQIYSGLLS